MWRQSSATVRANKAEHWERTSRGSMTSLTAPAGTNKNRTNNHHLNTTISLRKVKSLLRLVSLALGIIYIHNFQRIRIDERSRIHAATGDVNSIGLGPGHKLGEIAPASSSLPSTCHDTTTTYLSTIIYYYSTICLLWIMIIFARRRRQQIYLSCSIFLLCATASMFADYEICTTTLDLEQNISTNHIIATRSDGTSWRGNHVRISFKLHDPDDNPYPDTFSSRKAYKCGDRATLPPSIGKRTILNFTTSIHTDLKIGFIGDSIGAQFSQAFDAAALGKGNEEFRWKQYDTVKPEQGLVSECLSIASPVQGGGVTAFWRMFGLMSANNQRTTKPCSSGTHNDLGWALHQAATLVDHPLNNHTVNTETKNIVGRYDAFVIRLTHGWLPLQQFTKENIIEEISLLNKYAGAQTIIISTLPFSNNVRSYDDWMQVSKINQMIRDIARNWQPVENNGVSTILVQEFGNFTAQLIWTNAKHIGYNVSMPDFSQNGWELSETDFLFNRLAGQGKWSPSKPQVCSSQKFWMDDSNKEQCHLNRISVDGAHWCQNTLGPRHSASISCLLGCVYNGEEEEGKDKGKMRECEQECNENFMSINPVPKDWIGTGITLFSAPS